MKAKKVIALAMVMTMGLSMSTLGGSAAEGTGTTEVSYNNQNEIPDPENPADPEWVVTIPSSIVFTDTNKELDASVELVEKTALPAGDVTVTVKSGNNYHLQLGSGDDAVSYSLTYDGKLMTDTNIEVAVLNSSSRKKAGKAILTGNATKAGLHTDTLTYTVSYTK